MGLLIGFGRGSGVEFWWWLWWVMMGLGLRIIVDRCGGRSWWHGGSRAEF